MGSFDLASSLEMASRSVGGGDEGGGGNKRAKSKDNKCIWRDEDEMGRVFVCSNERYVHPTRKVQDSYGAEHPDILKTCAFHAEDCCGNHPGTQPKGQTGVNNILEKASGAASPDPPTLTLRP